MDQLDALRTFVAVAQRRSFAEAARGLHISPTAASRAVSELERTLGAVLLRRTTRSVMLTPEGGAYLERCRAALEELEDAARSLRGEDSEPRGRLIITAPVVFGRLHILPIVSGLLRAHRGLSVHLMLTDRVIRLAEEGIDVAVRIAHLADSALHAVKVAEVRVVLVASPAYLAERGMPSDAAALQAHDLIAFDSGLGAAEWRFGAEGRPVVRVEPRLLTNSIDATLEAALSGLGITRLYSYQTDAAVAAGRLVYLLPELEPQAVPVTLVFQANRRGTPNVRGFIAAAQSYFRTTQFAASPPASARDSAR